MSIDHSKPSRNGSKKETAKAQLLCLNHLEILQEYLISKVKMESPAQQPLSQQQWLGDPISSL